MLTHYTSDCEFSEMQNNLKNDNEYEVTIALLCCLALVLDGGYVLAFHFRTRRD